MAITRDTLHKKKLTGGRKNKWKKKRKHELGRQFINAKIGLKNIILIRVRGGNFKKRALTLEVGNFSWISLNVTKKTRVISVAYNNSSSEFTRTNTLVKSSLVYIDALPFKNALLKRKLNISSNREYIPSVDKNISLGILKKNKTMDEQMKTGKILARICSRPGQIGRVDGYIIEDAELEFYQKKIQKKT